MNRTDVEQERPRILLLTERSPSADLGAGMRLLNTIVGLQQVGRLHVCLVDSTRQGFSLPSDATYETSRVRARPTAPGLGTARRLASLMPSNTLFRRVSSTRAALLDTIGGAERWELVWYLRARVHVMAAGLFRGAAEVVDLDDLNDRLLVLRADDRRVNRPSGWRIRNARDRLDAALWRRLQHQIASQVDRVLVCSESDRLELGVDNGVVIPNGYPRREHSQRPPTMAPHLLFVGPMTYEPNRLAVEWFIRTVFPRVRAAVPGVQFDVVGDAAGCVVRGSETPGVVLHGYVPDVAPYCRQAMIAVVPLWSGGGTRLKVIEALAWRIPLVATSFGAAGHRLVPGVHFVAADTPEAFADACVSLIRDESRRRALADAGFRHFAAHLTDTATSDAVAGLARQLLGERAVAEP